jgi:hypothetical protein
MRLKSSEPVASNPSTMRLTVCVPLSLAAFGLVVALPDEEGQPPLEKKNRVEILSDTDFCL